MASWSKSKLLFVLRVTKWYLGEFTRGSTYPRRRLNDEWMAALRARAGLKSDWKPADEAKGARVAANPLPEDVE